MPKVVPEYKEEARKKIIRAAMSEIGKKGYKETRVEDIARKIGVSKAAVYHYYESKEAIMSAVAGMSIEHAVKNVFSPDRPESTHAVLKGALGQILDSTPEWFPGMICDMMSDAQEDGSARRTYDQMYEQLIDTVSGFLEGRSKRGELPREPHLAGIAEGLLALALGLLVQVSVGLDRKDAIEKWGEMVDLLMAGMNSAA